MRSRAIVTADLDVVNGVYAAKYVHTAFLATKDEMHESGYPAPIPGDHSAQDRVEFCPSETKLNACATAAR